MFHSPKTSVGGCISHVLSQRFPDKRDVIHFRNGCTSHFVSVSLGFLICEADKDKKGKETIINATYYYY